MNTSFYTQHRTTLLQSSELHPPQNTFNLALDSHTFFIIILILLPKPVSCTTFGSIQ